MTTDIQQAMIDALEELCSPCPFCPPEANCEGCEPCGWCGEEPAIATAHTEDPSVGYSETMELGERCLAEFVGRGRRAVSHY